MSIAGIDHVAVPTANPEKMLEFYRALGFVAPTPDEWRRSAARHFSVYCGENRINFHAPALWQAVSFTLRGPRALPGCGDFCLVWSGSADQLRERLQGAGAVIEEGPVPRTGGRDSGRAPGTSTYTRDPDGNLLEFIIYAQPPL
jgi:catechol 2,3-dioxygenase-like lactoylglutathione lyase family enzyme